MSISEIEITSDSNPLSIQNDFEQYKASQSLQISLEIEVDQEEIILNSIVEQLQAFSHIEELYIVISKQCILEHFHILTEGLVQLTNLKVLAITFQPKCFAGETHFQHLSSALSRMTQLIDLRVCVEKCNAFSQKALVFFNESLPQLSGLLKLKIQISEDNQFGDQQAEELSKGLNHISQLEELDLSLDLTYLTEKGMIALGNSLVSFNKTLQILRIVFEGQCKYQGISQVFQALPSLSMLKSLEMESLNEINVDEKELKTIVEYLSKLINLESLSLKKIFAPYRFNENFELIKQLSQFKMLKEIDLEILNFNEITLKSEEELQAAFNNLSRIKQLKLVVRDYVQQENQSISLLSKSFEKWNLLSSLNLEFGCIINKIDSFELMKSIKGLTNIQNLEINTGSGVILDQSVLDILRDSLTDLVNLKRLNLFIVNSRIRKNLNLNLNLTNLKNLEELILKVSVDIEIQGDNILPQLRDLDKLQKLELNCCTLNGLAINTFTTAFVNLKSLRNLTLSIKPKKNQITQELKFESLSSQKCLKNLNLRFDNIALSLEHSKSLCLSLLNLTNLTTFSLKSRFQSLTCLRNILNGLLDSKVKNLNLIFREINETPVKEDLELFGSVQFLENISLDFKDFRGSDEIIGILIESLKQLTFLKKIIYHKSERQVFYDNQNKTNLTDNKMNQLFLQSPRLLDIQNKYEKQSSGISLFVFDLIKEQKQLLKIRDIELRFNLDREKNVNYHSLIKQLKNLRSLKLDIQIGEGFSSNSLPERSLISDSPRLLTELVVSMYFPINFWGQEDYHLDEVRMITQFKYLIDLSFSSKLKLQKLDLIQFGKSLQQIDSIKNLCLKLNLGDKSSTKGFAELIKGIKSQQLLKRLSIDLKYQLTQKQNKNIILMIEAFKQLSYLTDLKVTILITPRFGLQISKKNEFLFELGKSLSFIENLRQLSLQLSFEDKQTIIDQDMHFLVNALKSNISLQSLEIQLKKAIISEHSIQALGKGLMYLKQLENCIIDFNSSEVDNCLGIISEIPSHENLRTFKLLKDNVKRISFDSLELILKQQKGKFKIEMIDNDIYKKILSILFEGEKLNLEIKQSSKNIFPVEEYLKLTQYMTLLSPNIDIVMQIQSCNTFSASDNSKLIFQQPAALFIQKLNLIINENRINIFDDGFFKMKQIKQLVIEFQKVNQIDQVVNILYQISNSTEKITELILSLDSYTIKDQSEMKKFISTIIKFQSLKVFCLSFNSISAYKQSDLIKMLQRKINSLVILSVKRPYYYSEQDLDDLYNEILQQNLDREIIYYDD